MVQCVVLITWETNYRISRSRSQRSVVKVTHEIVFDGSPSMTILFLISF